MKQKQQTVKDISLTASATARPFTHSSVPFRFIPIKDLVEEICVL